MTGEAPDSDRALSRSAHGPPAPDAMTSPWHKRAAQVLERLGTQADLGVSEQHAKRRLASDGPNRLTERARPSAWVRFAAQLKDITVLALLGAAAIAVLLGSMETQSGWIERFGDSIAILMIVVLNAIIGFVQEGRAHSALQALKGFLSPTATVLRDGARLEIPAEEIVVGDLFVLEEGARVPADGRLVRAAELRIDESSLTGESVGVAKNADAVLPSDTPLAERENMVFMSSHVQSGWGIAVTTHTAMATQVGQVAGLLEGVDAVSSPLERRMQQFGKRVVIGCAILAVALFGVGLLRLDVPVGFLLLMAVSLAVAAIPEGLPAITTVLLALGVRKMAAANAIVRRLAAVEALGSTHVICSDKTGTLTQNRMTVRTAWVAGKEFDLDSTPLDDSPSTAELVHAAHFAPGARAVAGSAPHYEGDPTDAALLQFHSAHAQSPPDGEVLRVLPFSSDRKLASVAFRPSKAFQSDGESGEPQTTLYCHGAPERVLASSNTVLLTGTTKALDDALRTHLSKVIDAWAHRGLRVLALARRQLEQPPPALDDWETGLQLIGLVGMSDPPRPEVRVAIAKARGAGVRTLMITGDHPTTARSIATELGLADETAQVLSSNDLAQLDDNQLGRQIDQIAVLARATPADKLRMVNLLQARGNVVAMTGDGVNDAPAIKAATIGVAMGKTGTDVAREVADLVLADDNYATIVSAIEQGRIIYANIQRFVAFLFASNAGLVLLVAVAMLLGWPAVLTPTQILWINLITNGLPALALGMEPKAADPMTASPRDPNADLLSAREWWQIAVVGFWLAAGGLALFAYTDPNEDLQGARSLAFSVMALGPIAYAFSARTEQPIWTLSPWSNRPLLVATAVALALQGLAIYTPGLEQFFGTQPLDGQGATLALAAALSVVLVSELTKPLLRRLG